MNNVLFSNEKLDLLFVKGKKIDFIKKIRSVVCEVKKKKEIWFVKIRSVLES